jgi:hypothetical protein
MNNLTTKPAMAMEKENKIKNLFYFPDQEEMENRNFQFQSIAEENKEKKMVWLFNKLTKEIMECE